jgi:hypothetical protein
LLRQKEDGCTRHPSRLPNAHQLRMIGFHGGCGKRCCRLISRR